MGSRPEKNCTEHNFFFFFFFSLQCILLHMPVSLHESRKTSARLNPSINKINQLNGNISARPPSPAATPRPARAPPLPAAAPSPDRTRISSSCFALLAPTMIASPGPPPQDSCGVSASAGRTLSPRARAVVAGRGPGRRPGSR